jgi:hypothetical protein
MAKTSTRTRDRAPAAPGVKSDAYVGMLALALIAQIAGAVFLWLDYKEYGDKKPPLPQAGPTQGRPVEKPPTDKAGADKGADKDKM